MNYVPKHFYRLKVKTWENKYRKMCVVSWEELLIVPTWPSLSGDDVLKLEDNKDTVHYIIPTSPFLYINVEAGSICCGNLWKSEIQICKVYIFNQAIIFTAITAYFVIPTN